MLTHPFLPATAAALAFAIALAASAHADIRGSSKNLQAALDAAPDGGRLPHVIRVGPGIYTGKLTVKRGKGPIHLIGAGPDRTILEFNDSAAKVTSPGTKGQPAKTLGTTASASVSVRADDFMAEGITFRNTHGEGSQAVALEISGNRMIFRNCGFTGWQDTLMVRGGSAYFEDCLIAGQCDFIFGAGKAWFERCEIRALGKGFIAAPSTDPKDLYGFVFSRCRFTPASVTWQTFLARPWGPHGAVVVMNSELPATIHPEGWDNWRKAENEKTARFAEGGNTGPGADRRQRVPWSRELRPEELRSLTPMLALRWDLQSGFLPSRLAALPAAERDSWLAYLNQSDRFHAAEQAILDAELKAAKLKSPVAPPAAGEDFKLPSKLKESWLASPRTNTLADAILSFQTPTGGWSKQVDYSKGPRRPGMQWSSQTSPDSPWHYNGTFDNGSTTTQLRFLIAYWSTTRRADVKLAFLRGLDYVLAAQFPNGAWPQVYPLEGGYHDNITFNDNATVLLLRALDAISRLDPSGGLIDAPRLRAANSAYQRGLAAVLRLQWKQNGTPTAWCAQFDPLSLKPAAARFKEPASLSGAESIAIVRFLMEIPEPPDDVRAAIVHALAWFEKSALTGLRKTKRDGRVWYDTDPSASGRLWARFYDPATNQPLFAGAQDGIIYASYNEMQSRNKAGYEFFTDDGNDLLGKYQAKWRAENAAGR